MRAEKIGRVLGIGLRVAGRVAGERISSSGGAASGGERAARPAADYAQRGRNAVKAGGNLTRALGGFFKPFQRVGGIVWLEAMGVLFFLPVLVFVPTLWRTRASFLHGPDHRTCVAAAIVVVTFFYLGVTSFLRARRKARSN